MREAPSIPNTRNPPMCRLAPWSRTRWASTERRQRSLDSDSHATLTRMLPIA